MIIRILWLLKQCVNSKLVTISILNLVLAVSPAILTQPAEYKPPADQKLTQEQAIYLSSSYTPPDNQKPPQTNTDGTGTR